MRNALLLSFFCVLIATMALSQGTLRKVHGTLLDPLTGDPLPGVNVVIKGTTTGTTTDARGFYELTAPEDGTLVFSFVGFQTKEIPVAAVLRTMGEPAAGETTAEPVKVFRHTIEGDPDKTLSPYFFVQSDDPSTDQLPLKSTNARVNIAGVIADVRVEQVYINTGKTTIEAMYIFPGSTQAAVYGMSMRIGNRILTARIREKQEARREYEEAREAGKTATLLEQQRPNVFQMNVANILPGDTITVALQYTELLVPKEGTYEFVYPTVVGPRYSETPDDEAHAGERWVESPYTAEGVAPMYDFHFLAQLNSAIPIKQVTSTSHKVDVQFTDPSTAIIQLDTGEIDGGNRDVIIKYRLRGNQVQSGVLLYPHEDENFFLLMVEPPDKPTLDQIPGREYIFIIDVSGSMSGFPLDVAKEFIRSLITSLRPTDKFNVMLFESSNNMLYKRAVEATQENVKEAMRVIDERNSGGGTRLLPALHNALSHPKNDDYARTFVVVTDGYVTVEKEAMSLIRSESPPG
ncbi:MAG: VWA domain-containing protein [Bacteroidia bacterium]|nr:VWA domain-containing protein [Bacteroidia bacterium]